MGTRVMLMSILSVILLAQLYACDTSQGSPSQDSSGPPDGDGDTPSDAFGADANDAPGEDSGDATSQDTSNRPDSSAEPLAPWEYRGWVRIEHQANSDYAGIGVQAEFWATPVPHSQEAVMESGECSLMVGALTGPWVSCTPECEWNKEICIDGQCVAYPERSPVGELTVKGLKLNNGGTTVKLSANSDGSYDGFVESFGNWFEPGDKLEADAPGGAGPALDLDIRGVTPFVGDQPKLRRAIEDNTDLTVTWTPAPDDPPGTRIIVFLDTGWHGAGNLTTIICDAEDDGELTIPSAMVQQFPIPSCGECAMSYMGRYQRDTIETDDGFIEFMLLSKQSFVAWWE